MVSREEYYSWVNRLYEIMTEKSECMITNPREKGKKSYEIIEKRELSEWMDYVVLTLKDIKKDPKACRLLFYLYYPR